MSETRHPFVRFEISKDKLAEFEAGLAEASRRHGSLKDAVYRANESIYEIVSDLEDSVREVEDAVEEINDVANAVRASLQAQLESVGMTESDLQESQPDAYAMLRSWHNVAWLEDFDTPGEIDAPKLDFKLPLVQTETPAEVELKQQIAVLQKALKTLQDCRQAGTDSTP